MKTMMRLVAVALSLGVACALPAAAQTASAAISGHVVDQSKGAVPDAEVKLIDEGTKALVATTHTNAGGDFNFADVNPATYSIDVTASGYKELQKVHLVHFALVNLDAGTFTLQVGTVQQTVTIQADITALQTESSERSGVLDTQQTDNLLSVGRDVMAMTKVIPGVVENSYGAASLGTTTAPVVNGVNNEYSMSTVDGAIANTRGLATVDTPPNLDAVKEVSVNESNYTAQYGGEAGGMFTYVTKNGTNRFHGGLYEYFRNEDLNANQFFNKYGLAPSAYIARPRYRYNVAGGTIGGPIYWPHHFNSGRNKYFFFVSVEDSPITAPDGLKYYMAPTLLQTQGNFTQTQVQGSATPAAVNIAYPGYSSNAGYSGGCPNTGTPNANCVSYNGTYNIIPPGYINAQTESLLTTMYNASLGNPNLGKNNTYAFTNLAVSDNDYNYITNYSASKPVNQEIFRIDADPTQKLRMFFRGLLTTVNDNDYSSPANDLPWLMPVNYKLSEPNFVYNIVYTITPTLVNELNLGTAGWAEHQLYDPSDLAKVTLNSSAFDLPSLYAGVNPLNLYPSTTFSLSSSNSASAMNYGWDSRFPMADQVRSVNATDQVTKSWHNHTFVAGAEFGRDIYRQINHNRVGTFNFAVNTSDPNDSNWSYANADMGVINQYSQDTQLVTYDPLTNRTEWFYQDTWKPFHNLTIDAGIRNSYDMGQKLPSGNNFVPSLYKAASAPTLYGYGFNSAGKQVAVDPTGKSACSATNSCPVAYAGLMVPGSAPTDSNGNFTNGILYVKTPGYPEGTFYGAGLEWAPRFGFSWAVTPSTVLRGGFGMYYTVRPRSGQEGDLTNNAPTTNGPTQYYSSANSTAPNYYAAAGISNLSSPYGVGHALPLHTTPTYAEEGSFGIQQALKAGIVLDVAYVGTFTRHATYTAPINEVPYGAEFAQANQYCSKESKGACTTSSILNDNFFRPYQGLGSISYQLYTLTANYNALQVRVTRRFNNGLEFGGAYTFGRAMDYIDSYNGGGPLYQNMRAWEYGPASWDLKHMLVINYLWALPRASQLFGDKSLWNNIATRQVFDNWQISGFGYYYSGAPAQVGLSVTGSPNITGGGDGQRVVQTCDPWHKASGTRVFHQWFNTSCFEPPLQGSAYNIVTGAPATQYSTGSGVFAPKYDYFLPGYTNFDTALFKNFPVENKVTLQLRVETYNTFNHTEYSSVSSTATFANATSQSTAQTAATFGQLNNTGTTGNLEGPRVMQIALRIDF